MSWDNDGSFDGEYYDNRCFPEEFDSMDEYNASFGGHSSAHIRRGRKSDNTAGICALIIWIIILLVFWVKEQLGL